VADGDAISNALGRLADDPTVRGLVVPVDSNSVVSTTYASWSASPNYCDVNRANEVADAIRDQIISPTQAIFPAPDRTTIANEWTYENWLYVNWDALRAASHQRYVLTDDFYGVRPGEELYCRDYVWLPSLAVGRLVETPDEILGMINGYLNENTLDAQTALAAGYDFFADCATALRDTFDGQALTIDTLISNSWDADDLRAAWPNRWASR